jgi:hypothetical protein
MYGLTLFIITLISFTTLTWVGTSTFFMVNNVPTQYELIKLGIDTWLDFPLAMIAMLVFGGLNFFGAGLALWDLLPDLIRRKNG